jgi:hypothetical protein
MDVLSLFGQLIGRLDRAEVELFVMVAQRVWFRRNSYVFEGMLPPPIGSMKDAVETLEDYRKAHENAIASIPRQRNPMPVRWSKPSVGVIKMNWDAAMNRLKKLVGVGIIARDSCGKVLASVCSIQRYIADPSTAEAWGARQGADFGRVMGYSNVILEGDALEVVLALQNDEGASSFGNLVIETKGLLSCFGSGLFQHVGREGNKAAHCLAKYAVVNHLNHMWVESYPSYLSGTVNVDFNLSDDI